MMFVCLFVCFVCGIVVGWLVNGIATNKHKQIVLKVSSARPTLIPPDEKKDPEAGIRGMVIKGLKP